MLLGFALGVAIGGTWGFWSGVAVTWWLLGATRPLPPPDATAPDPDADPLVIRQAHDIVNGGSDA